MPRGSGRDLRFLALAFVFGGIVWLVIVKLLTLPIQAVRELMDQVGGMVQ